MADIPHELPSVVVNGKEYTFNHAQPFVQHAVRLLLEKWDRDFDDRTLVPKFAFHKMLLLAERHGREHP